jgi:hypothetical protein
MGILRISVTAAISAAMVLATPAMADIMGFNNGANFTANGGATFAGSNLTLTNSQTSEQRSAFYNTVQSIGGDWVASFDYQATMPEGCLCDGAAFILQNAPAGANAVSTAGFGGAYGYYGITPSAAIELSQDGGYSPGAPGTGFYTDGAVPQAGGAPLLSVPFLNSGDLISVEVSYIGGDLTESLDDLTTPGTFFHDYGLVNLPLLVGGNTAFIGFSGGTGAGADTQVVSSFSFTTPAAVPEPASLALLATVSGCCIWLLRRKSASGRR